MRNSHHIKDANREKSIFAFRSVLALIIVLAMLAALIARMYHLQITNHSHYQTLSDKNRMQLRSVAPTRGLIYDRNGVLLADNQPIFSLALIPEQVDDLDFTIKQLGEIIDLQDRHVTGFKKRLKRSRRPYKEVVLKSKLTEEEIARIEVRRHTLPGVEVQAELARYYPLGEATAHSIGYVGRINEKELAKLDPQNYSATNYIGKLGVERFYESELHGSVGFETVEINASNRILRSLDHLASTPGKDLVLHMDARLQLKVMELLEGKRAALVAIEPKTGGVLAQVSTPSYDPNKFVTGIDHKSYGLLRDSIDTPLFNRALKGQYPPGSTIKPVVGLAGLDVGVTSRDYTINDRGRYQLKNDDRIYRNWKREGHGIINLKDAIAESSDTYFYELAFNMGVDRMSRYLGYFGFGSNLSLDVSEGRSGILPSREWKRAWRGLPWYPGDSLNMGIGQGFMLATPFQLATMTALIANHGQWVAPRLLKSTRDGSIVLSQRPDKGSDVALNKPDNWDYIVETMEEVMHGKKGTARASGARSSYRIAGKTGTAQVVEIPQGEEYDAEALAERHRDHALFVGFAPADDPVIAVAVIVENGGGGSSAAAPIARAVFDEWINVLSVDADQGVLQ
ncbi:MULTISPECIES: penicillin-binding protein 2 [unclassified Oleiphilus]|nr:MULTISPECIES: penicillin-binding protein 2 [unclassified Oleiphilus]